jgi:hypothetical protein
MLELLRIGLISIRNFVAMSRRSRLQDEMLLSGQSFTAQFLLRCLVGAKLRRCRTSLMCKATRS